MRHDQERRPMFGRRQDVRGRWRGGVIDLCLGLSLELLSEQLQLTDAVVLCLERQHHAYFAEIPASALRVFDIGQNRCEAAVLMGCSRELVLPHFWLDQKRSIAVPVDSRWRTRTASATAGIARL